MVIYYSGTTGLSGSIGSSGNITGPVNTFQTYASSVDNTYYICVDYVNTGGSFLEIPSASQYNQYGYIEISNEYSGKTGMLIAVPAAGEMIEGLTGLYIRPNGRVTLFNDPSTGWVIENIYPTSIHGWQGYVAGKYYTCTAVGTAISTATMAQDTFYALPFYVNEIFRYDKVGFACSTTGFLGTYGACGLYADNGNCYPGRLIFNTTTSGTQIPANSVPRLFNNTGVLAPGLYWLTTVCSRTGTNTMPILRGFAVGHLDPNYLGFDSPTSTAPNLGWRVLRSFASGGSFPDPFPSTGTLLTAAPLPAMYLRKY